MSKTKLLLGVGAVVMGAAIIYALTFGDFLLEASILFEHPWFHVSLIDLYVGFLLFCGWIVFRERSRGRAAAWIVLILTLGNFAACVYALVAAIKANGDWRAFWLGSRNTTQGGDPVA